jgi:hypothetical protein
VLSSFGHTNATPLVIAIGGHVKLKGRHVQKLKVSLPDYLRDQLEAAAAAQGVSLGEVIRRKLEEGFALDEADAPTRDLMDTVKALAKLIKKDTGHAWFLHLAASNILCRSIVARFARWRPQEGEGQFRPEELPTTGRLLMGAMEVETIALALEALEAQQRYQRQDQEQFYKLGVRAGEEQAKKRGQAA